MRTEGNDDELRAAAVRNAQAIGAGYTGGGEVLLHGLAWAIEFGEPAGIARKGNGTRLRPGLPGCRTIGHLEDHPE